MRPNDQAFDCPSCYGPLSRDRDLYFRHHAVGGLIHLHLGALPEVVAAFAGPHRPSLKRPSTVGLSQEPADDDGGDQDA
jgi:cobyrinic acid a,c-diamide synthase